MKLKDGVIITSANGEYVAVAAGDAGRVFNGMIRMNKTAAFIMENMREDTDEAGLVEALCGKYDVDAETARKNVKIIVDRLRSAGLIGE
ncbi:MAG: PqqD family protein [Clostridia bacterium]|nr:PqqD family protein [Clostridia bacterium]